MLRTDFKDDVLSSGVDHRTYEMTDEGNNRVSFTDVTSYQQEGDTFGAAEINATNGAVNTLYTYLSGTLPANTDNLTITAPNDNKAYFDGGHVDVYVPGDKVESLILKKVEVTAMSGSTASKCKITFSGTVNSQTTIEVYCK